METKIILFRIALSPVLLVFAWGGLKVSVSFTLVMSDKIGDVWTVSLLIAIGLLVFRMFRNIKPKTRQVWDFEYPFFSVEVLSLAIWYFLICFLSVTAYMILNGALAPFR